MPDDASLQLQQWIDRLRAGDEAARRELIGHACDRLRRLTHTLRRDFRRLAAWEDTDDVLHNAVLRLLRALETVTPGTVADFFRLAAQQIRRELLDLSRHYFGPAGPGARQAGPLPDDGLSSSPQCVPPSDNTHEPSRLARWTEFHERVEALPAEEREVVDLIWYQGLSQPDAAKLLNISYATLKRRWVSARLRLKAVLDADVPAV